MITKTNSLTFYLILQKNEDNTESIAGWSRINNIAQAELRQMELVSDKEFRIFELVMKQEDLDKMRRVAHLVAEDTLNNIKDVAKRLNLMEKDILLLRGVLVKKIEKARRVMVNTPLGYVYDEEVQRYWNALQENAL